MLDNFSTNPVKELRNKVFKELLKDKAIEISPHAKDHLSLAQRKVFIDNELVLLLKQNRPKRVFLQRNKRHAAYYKLKGSIRTLILEIQKEKIIIISFYDPTSIPKPRFENEE